MDLNDIYTEVIAEHSISTRNKRVLDNPDAVLQAINPSCGDEIQIAVKITDGVIEDIAFTGSGCAISQASASIMVDLTKGKTLENARSTIHLFLKMIKREVIDDESLDALEEAVALKNIANMPARVKCATLSWHTLLEIIGERDT